ncbi:MAG: malto-oligosyltrehalose synthase [Acidobacteriaceae bacterium]
MSRTPSSTYRLQLHAGFTFDDAARIADYLSELGISHIYASPYMQAAPGSTHGYDIVDHQRVNSELGGEEAHRRFCSRLGECGMGQVLDIVPNHMSLVPENRYWWDVLENAASSRYAAYFDIDWNPAEMRLRDKVLVPILGDQYGRVLSSGDLRVVRQDDRFLVQYADHVLPVAPRSMSVILSRAADLASSDTLHFLSESYARLPAPDSVERSVILTRHRDKTVLATLLLRTWREDHRVEQSIDRAIAELNSNIDALDNFLNLQNYRLAYWRTADQELGYRRFFDVNTLVGLRVEREHVFTETHSLIAKWLKEGVLDGIRVDHPDGLRDPFHYFERLRKTAPDAWIVAEKILDPGERLRKSWPIQGTTGYDFLNQANGVLIDPDGLTEITKIYADFTGESTDYTTICHEKKLSVMQEGLGSDVNRLTSLFVEICEGNRDRRDYTRTEIRRAIREVAACFPVYRTYVDAECSNCVQITEEDEREIYKAVAGAKNSRQDVDPGLFDFLADVLCLRSRGKLEAEFVMRFQQFTGPVMAKGVEDTALYCYNRLTGLNEVGSDPSRQGVSVDEFHTFCADTHRNHPLTMVTLSTHDTKRSEDVRARIAVLSEMAVRWRSALRRFSRTNAQFRSGKFPDRNAEYLYYQTLIGAWPLTPDRAAAYMLKAARESKQHTSWTAGNAEYEAALQSFIHGTLQHQPFLQAAQEIVDRVMVPGRINSLAQTLLKHTAPGVPDQYQGTELWNLSLVDPDNRRPVDYDRRRALLAELPNLSATDIAAKIPDPGDDGLPKLFIIHRSLTLRREHPEWFGPDATYTPLAAQGPKAASMIGFLRSENVAVIVPRLPLTANGNWPNTTVCLPAGSWKSAFSKENFIGGSQLELQAIFDNFPVALLTRES